MKSNIPEQAPGAYVLTGKQQKYLRTKYFVDALMALVFLIVLAVPMAVIALLQKLTSPKDPILFRHQRIGKDGKAFELMKFRSMRRDTPQYVAANDFQNSDDYITGFGRFLRSTSLDELPQLIHVLRGEMSLIGPRPLIPQEREMHELRMASGVYQLRPGITGWAQVNGRDRISDAEKAALDREYLEHVCFAWDWKIFWITIKKVIGRADINTVEQ